MCTFLFCSSVRSVGSIALRKAEDIDFKYHFDFFSVNFNEELVALYGGSLQKQTKFVHECIKTILKLYKVREHLQINKRKQPILRIQNNYL